MAVCSKHRRRGALRQEVLVLGPFGPPRSHARARAGRDDRQGFPCRPQASKANCIRRKPIAGGVTGRSRVCSGFASICRSRRATPDSERFAGGCGHRGADGSSSPRSNPWRANRCCWCAAAVRHRHRGVRALVGRRHSKPEQTPSRSRALGVESGRGSRFDGVRREARRRSGLWECQSLAGREHSRKRTPAVSAMRRVEAGEAP